MGGFKYGPPVLAGHRSSYDIGTADSGSILGAHGLDDGPAVVSACALLLGPVSGQTQMVHDRAFWM